MPRPDGKGVMHAELLIGDSIIMLREENPQAACRSAEALGGSPVNFYVYLENVTKSSGKPWKQVRRSGRLSTTCSGGTGSARCRTPSGTAGARLRQL
jgi:uncharacterized glyoxalase superfamily protein PhnB